MQTLDKVFVVDVRENSDNGDNDNYVTLQPKLANYRAILSYDSAGNANVTIVRASDDAIMLDASLDNGEINDMDTEFFA